eukprot:CAMPEP_0173384262 /NCGR_PEP_ID=MMETSP1356-20130122/6834_1 /TAXON_ID=77927 ORGANISM="Hemiselmis virescens, Strain PCC157" /NCGR_SAMPLE_ID=MMETSP1356 /ASSEMBLY_ACC=CAM_ASM_000847 /LENGTH=425 /DNA_ID=CAMNT_0014339521 /DNA_START=126 /DNA_END=1403 /DNA_ORIENTATION=+
MPRHKICSCCGASAAPIECACRGAVFCSNQCAQQYWPKHSAHCTSHLEKEFDAARYREGGSDEGEVADVAHALGMALMKRDRMAEAEECLCESAKIYRTMHGAGNAKLTATLGNIGSLYLRQGRVDAALVAYSEVVESNKGCEASREVAMALECIGIVCTRQNRYQDALDRYEEARDIFRELSGEDDKDSARVLGNMAQLCLLQKRHHLSAGMREQALRVQRTLIGSSPSGDKDAALNLLGLGEAYLHVHGKADQACDCLREGLEIVRRLYPQGHPLVTRFLVTLGSAHAQESRKEEALAAWEACLPALRRAHGDAHETVRKVMKEVVVMLEAVGRKEDAVKMREAKVTAKRASHGSEHPAVAAALYELAMCQGRVGLKKKALWSVREANEIYTRRGLSIGNERAIKCRDLLEKLEDRWSEEGYL